MEKLPIKVRKRRVIPSERKDGEDQTVADGEPEIEVVPENGEDAQMAEAGWEEFYDYVFPDDERSGQGKTAKVSRLMEMARKWNDQNP